MDPSLAAFAALSRGPPKRRKRRWGGRGQKGVQAEIVHHLSQGLSLLLLLPLLPALLDEDEGVGGRTLILLLLLFLDPHLLCLSLEAIGWFGLQLLLLPEYAAALPIQLMD